MPDFAAAKLGCPCWTAWPAKEPAVTRRDEDGSRRASLNARLGRGVVDLAVLAGLAVDGADVDDAAVSAIAHALDDRPAHVEARTEVGLDDLLPLFRRHLVQGAVARDTGVVDQHLHRPEVALDLCDAFPAGVEIADVPLVRTRAGGGGEFIGGFLVAAIVGRNGESCIDQRLRYGRANPSRAARDNGYLAHALPQLI